MKPIKLHEINDFSIRMDQEMNVFGTSYNLHDLDKNLFINKKVDTILNLRFNNEHFKNDGVVKIVQNLISKVLDDKLPLEKNIVVINKASKINDYCEFNIEINIYRDPDVSISLRISNFKSINKTFGDYSATFNYMSNFFDVLKREESIGQFVVDFKKNPNIIIGNDVLPQLLDVKRNPNHEYYISRTNVTESQNQILRSRNFFIKTDSLINGDISVLEDIWEENGKWLKVEAKILKREENNSPLLLAGVLYDITDYMKNKDLEYIQSIYDLAITSGGIGIFYYNHEKYPKDYFEANDIYADMVGLNPNEDGLYFLNDFTDTLLQVEDEISNNEDIRKSLSNLLKGSINGTTDDILKIKNSKTNNIVYLLSSSRIDSRYSDGTPSKFGGIIIDITERINSQKNHIQYAYLDQLTNLPNNRKLLKDMKKRSQGIGLFFDLDHFKLINDKYGHMTGNKILKIFADTLIDMSIKYNFTYPYRLYGDEFFVFCENQSEQFMEEYNSFFKVLLSKKVKKKHPDIIVQASVGVSSFSKEVTVDEFIKLADYAMYKEKIKKSERKQKE